MHLNNQNEIYVPTEKELAEVDMSILHELQKLTPEQRLIRHEGARILVEQLRALGRKYYGFDPATIAQDATREG